MSGHQADWASWARHALESHVRRIKRDAPPRPADCPHHGVFVTLRQKQRLRGCIGILDPEVPLAAAIGEAARLAASRDPCFAPLTVRELALVRLEVSILGLPRPLRSVSEFEVGRHGVIVEGRGRRGLFLPQVASEHRLDAETLLARCFQEKAGLPAEAWRAADVAVSVLEAETHADR